MVSSKNSRVKLVLGEIEFDKNPANSNAITFSGIYFTVRLNGTPAVFVVVSESSEELILFK